MERGICKEKIKKNPPLTRAGREEEKTKISSPSFGGEG